jgi:SAM-dependent methyltransferase
VNIDRSQRTVFDTVADLYDEVRPGYPEELVEDVLTLSGIPPDGRILEVGCGPGNATLPFARRGYRMLCVELGERLAALAAAKCRPYSHVRVINQAFEDWPLEEKAFDLVISAEAFHWIPPEIGYPKIARALVDAGSAALFWIVDLDPQTDLSRAIDSVYQEIAPEYEDATKSVTPEWLTRQIVGNFAASGCFGPVTVRSYPWSSTYTGEQYVKLLRTRSTLRGRDEGTRADLFDQILGVIEQFGGSITLPLQVMLFHAEVLR